MRYREKILGVPMGEAVNRGVWNNRLVKSSAYSLVVAKSLLSG